MADEILEIEVDGVVAQRPLGAVFGQQHVREFLQLIEEDYDYGVDSTKASYRYNPSRVFCDVCWLGKRSAEHDADLHDSAKRLMEERRGEHR